MSARNVYVYLFIAALIVAAGCAAMNVSQDAPATGDAAALETAESVPDSVTEASEKFDPMGDPMFDGTEFISD